MKITVTTIDSKSEEFEVSGEVYNRGCTKWPPLVKERGGTFLFSVRTDDRSSAQVGDIQENGENAIFCGACRLAPFARV